MHSRKHRYFNTQSRPGKVDANLAQLAAPSAHLRWMHGSNWCCQRMSEGTYECRAWGEAEAEHRHVRFGWQFAFTSCTQARRMFGVPCYSCRPPAHWIGRELPAPGYQLPKRGLLVLLMCVQFQKSTKNSSTKLPEHTSIARDVLSSMPSRSTMISMSAEQRMAHVAGAGDSAVASAGDHAVASATGSSSWPQRGSAGRFDWSTSTCDLIPLWPEPGSPCTRAHLPPACRHRSCPTAGCRARCGAQ